MSILSIFSSICGRRREVKWYIHLLCGRECLRNNSSDCIFLLQWFSLSKFSQLCNHFCEYFVPKQNVISTSNIYSNDHIPKAVLNFPTRLPWTPHGSYSAPDYMQVIRSNILMFDKLTTPLMLYIHPYMRRPQHPSRVDDHVKDFYIGELQPKPWGSYPQSHGYGERGEVLGEVQQQRWSREIASFAYLVTSLINLCLRFGEAFVHMRSVYVLLTLSSKGWKIPWFPKHWICMNVLCLPLIPTTSVPHFGQRC